MTPAEKRSVEVRKRTARGGPYYLLVFKMEGRTLHKARKLSLGKLSNIVHNWINNGIEEEGDDSGPPTPADTTFARTEEE